jgi:hypothetical protein
MLDPDPSLGPLLAGKYDLLLVRAEAAIADDHFPSCATTLSQRAIGSA